MYHDEESAVYHACTGEKRSPPISPPRSTSMTKKGIRENARRVNAAFSWNKGFKEYFAVKATPNPYLLKILQEEGCGVDCSSYTELLMSEACGFRGSDIMFSSNDTPAQDMKKAYDLGAYINLDDLTHVEFLEKGGRRPQDRMLPLQSGRCV